MEAHQQDSICAPVPGTRPNHPTTPRPHDQRDPEGIPAKEDGEGGRINIGATGRGPPPPQGSLTPNEGLVQCCGLPFHTVFSGNPRSDHGRARQTVSSISTPGGEYLQNINPQSKQVLQNIQTIQTDKKTHSYQFLLLGLLNPIHTT